MGLQNDVLAFDIALRAQSFAKSVQERIRSGRRGKPENAMDARNLLRAGRNRPGKRTSSKCNEISTPHGRTMAESAAGAFQAGLRERPENLDFLVRRGWFPWIPGCSRVRIASVRPADRCRYRPQSRIRRVKKPCRICRFGRPPFDLRPSSPAAAAGSRPHRQKGEAMKLY